MKKSSHKVVHKEVHKEEPKEEIKEEPKVEAVVLPPTPEEIQATLSNVQALIDECSKTMVNLVNVGALKVVSTKELDAMVAPLSSILATLRSFL